MGGAITSPMYLKKYKNSMNLKKFENQELFEQYKQSSEYKEPNVALVGDNIMYNGSASSSGGSDITYYSVKKDLFIELITFSNNIKAEIIKTDDP